MEYRGPTGRTVVNCNVESFDRANIKSQGFKELGEFMKQVSSTEFGGQEESKKEHSEYKADSNIHLEFWINKSIQ